jgi:hypothetical protein
METTTFIKTLHYGTLRIVAIDLAEQIEDHDTFFVGSRKPDQQDIESHKHIVTAFGEVIKIYCGEGGIPLTDKIHQTKKGLTFENLVDKYLPEIKDTLR